MREQSGTGPKKVRGMAPASVEMIEAMRAAAEAAQPITGRGIGYKLFTAGLIPSMARSEMKRVYRLLKEARERGLIPWEWIVDETRDMERVSTWSSPRDFAAAAMRQYRRDFWDHAATSASRCGARRGRCAEFWPPSSTSTASDSASCTDLPARPPCTISPSAPMAESSSRSMSATTIHRGSTCRRPTCRPASSGTMASMSSLFVSLCGSALHIAPVLSSFRQEGR